VHVRGGRQAELCPHRGQYLPITGNRAQFRARKCFHGVDQHREPQILAASCSPRLKLLAHRLSSKPAEINSNLANAFPATLPEKKPARCDLVHTSMRGVGLNLRNGRENPPIAVRSEGRLPRRLRPDHYRRRSGFDRIDLSHPALIDAGARGPDTPPVWVSTPARNKVHLRIKIRCRPVARTACCGGASPEKPVKHQDAVSPGFTHEVV
jgi:hypothetical protein